MTGIGDKHGMREALIRRAEGLLDACRIERAPVDLIRIARHLGIQRIRELDVRLDGQLLQLDDGTYEVVLSTNAPHTRKRFTLAHEIAHIIVAINGKQEVSCGDGPTEELCNSVAAELLLPKRFLAGALSAKIDVAAIRQIATRFQCSLEATGWRILNVGAVTGALLIWRDLGRDSMEVAAAPHTFGFSSPFKSGDVLDCGSLIFEQVTANRSGNLDFGARSGRRRYAGDYMRLNKTVLMYVQESQPAAGDVATDNTADWIQGKLF